ncbi:MAG: hypothetical protein LUG23_07140 [Oscillospiraceae bacterium]|nr:hypothetical protein [Oscillospiraceae bacterium]
MATSSIFYNFTITDEKAAERFADVLDKAAQQPSWEPQSEVDPLVRDPETIKAIAIRAVAAHRKKAE